MTFLRHWPLWGMLGVTLILGIALVPVFQQRASIRWVEQKVGGVTTERGWVRSKTPKPILLWLEKKLGNKWSRPIDVVVVVDLSGADILDSDLEQLRKFEMLEAFYADQTNISDVGLAHLRGLSKLKRLYLNNTKVTDVGLAHLAENKALEELYIANTHVTDVGLLELHQLPNLRRLYLIQSKVTDEGLLQLQGHPSLKRLTVNGRHVTGEGVDALQKVMPKCKITH